MSGMPTIAPIPKDETVTSNVMGSPMRTRAMASTSALQDGAEEAAGPLLDGIGHDLSGAALFDDARIRHDNEVVRDIARELHLVRDHDHGHAACSEFPHDGQDF